MSKLAAHIGTDSFIARLEKALGRVLRRGKTGTKGSQKKKGNLLIKYGVPGILEKKNLLLRCLA